MTKESSTIQLIPNFITLIDENSTPILVHVMSPESGDVNKVLKYNTFSNISLDYFNSQLFQWSTPNDNSPIRMLFEVESVIVFAMWVKSTGLKIILGFNSNDKFHFEDDPNVNNVFDKVKKIYVRIKSNPFFDIEKLHSNETVNAFGERFEEEFNAIPLENVEI